MKHLLALMTVVTILITSSTGRTQPVSMQYLGPGCGPATGIPWVDLSGNVKFTAKDPTGSGWPCVRQVGFPNYRGIFVLVVSLPSSAVTPLPSPFGTCNVRGTIAMLVPELINGGEGTVTLGPPSLGFNVYLQGVLAFYTEGTIRGRTCPFYLSTTPVWRIWR